jgi:hypothetical protein
MENRKHTNLILGAGIVLAGGVALVVLRTIAASLGASVGTDMRESVVTVGALARAGSAPDVAAACGGPLEAKHVTGTIAEGTTANGGPVGNAKLVITFGCPNAGGTLHVVADKGAGGWQYAKLDAEIGGRAQVHVIETAKR